MTPRTPAAKAPPRRTAVGCMPTMCQTAIPFRPHSKVGKMPTLKTRKQGSERLGNFPAVAGLQETDGDSP